MASGTAAEVPEWVERLRDWRQGDYTLELSQIILATALESGDLVPSAGQVVGLVVVSQTCDIVNWGNDKEWVTVAALREVDEATTANVYRGSTPAWAALECAPRDNVVADLNQMMTLHKSVLAELKREEGFKNDRSRVRFADALSRKHGRFAFPNAFSDNVLSPLRNRIKKAHEKTSDQGAVYRSILLTRAVATPSWDASAVRVGFRFVLVSEERREAPRDLIAKIVSEHLDKIEWPDGFLPEEPSFVLQTMDEMTAQEWYDSQEIDWQFISRSTT